MKQRKLFLILVSIGILLSLYAVFLHYDKSGSSICDIGETFSCDKVNKSPWATLGFVPVSILGTLSYLLLFTVVLKGPSLRKMLAFTRRDLWTYIFGFVLFMLAFQVYLTVVEITIIHAYCLVCLANQTLLLVLTYLTWKEFQRSK